jgi:hypothetical protein
MKIELYPNGIYRILKISDLLHQMGIDNVLPVYSSECDLPDKVGTAKLASKFD